MTAKVRLLTRRQQHRTLAALLRMLNPFLRGWSNYFRHGVSSRKFNYVDHFAFWRIVGWLRKRHHGLNWGTLHRPYLPVWEVRDAVVHAATASRVRSARAGRALASRRNRPQGTGTRRRATAALIDRARDEAPRDESAIDRASSRSSSLPNTRDHTRTIRRDRTVFLATVWQRNAPTAWTRWARRTAVTS